MQTTSDQTPTPPSDRRPLIYVDPKEPALPSDAHERMASTLGLQPAAPRSSHAGHAVFRLPLVFPDCWDPATVGPNQDGWPHEAWEPVAAMLWRELRTVAPERANAIEYDLVHQVIAPILDSGPFERDDFLRRLRELRVTVPRRPAHRPKGTTDHPAERVWRLYHALRPVLQRCRLTPRGAYHRDTEQRIATWWKSAREEPGAPRRFPLGPFPAEALRARLKPEPGRETKPMSASDLACELLARGLGISQDVIRKYLKDVAKQVPRRRRSVRR